MRGLVFVLMVLVLAACSGGSDNEGPADLRGNPDQAVEDMSEVPDGGADSAELPPDVVGEETVTPDDTLYAGVAAGPAFAPLGIPTAGYGQGVEDKPHSPFTDAFAATQRQQTPIQAKALYLERGEAYFLLVRLDKIGTTAEILDEFTRRLGKATGRDWDGHVILASTHTHLGPGRVWENMLGEFANDLFWVQYYNRYVDDIVAVAQAAISAKVPARVGHGVTECPECHNDRRCENPELLDSTLRVIRVDHAETGTPLAAVVNFPIHGTVFGWQDYVLSGDAPGMIEHKLQERFAQPVEVLLLQSWGGDVSPADPEIAGEMAVNDTIPGQYDRLERIGYAAADHVMAVWDDIETSAEVTFSSATIRPTIGYELLEYEEGEWNYPYGGMMCGTSEDAPCWGEEGDKPTMACFPMGEGMAPSQFTLSAWRVGDVLFFTVPGEPHTDYALDAAEAVKAATGFEEVAVIGYAQDHWGYIMKEYDWWLGGYEPTVSFWGPKQGDFMAQFMPEAAALALDPDFALSCEDNEPLPTVLGQGDLSSYKAMDSLGGMGVLSDPDSEVAASGEAIFTWQGGDPWLGTPHAVLQQESDGTWEDVQTADGRLFDNLTYHMETSLVWEPTWESNEDSTPREFHWTVRMPGSRNVPTPSALPAGTYRFRVKGTLQEGGDSQLYELESAPFELVL